MFKLKSKYNPAGDQHQAITSLVNYLNYGHDWQTLWGVTGSGKTFTMANIIEKISKPTLVIAHNKTLAAQLAQEFKEFFPDAAVHYFVSYYDYYQPEAYVSKTDTYIEKEATINEEIDRLRHAATQDLLTRKDVIIVASVSCIYGIGDINQYTRSIFDIEVGKNYSIEDILKNLVKLQYKRAGTDFKPSTFLVSGDILEIFPASSETVFTIEFWGDEVNQITRRNYLTGEIFEYLKSIQVFPAKHTVTSKERIDSIIPEISKELEERLKILKENKEIIKHERLKTKVEYDMEMMQEVGYVNGIENYSRYLDGRKSGEAPYTLIDYFGNDFLTFIDESHMTIPQIGGMYAGDKSRKENLVENGFRLASALDNRPLKFSEFESKIKQVVAVSATPAIYEIKKSSTNPNAFSNFDTTGGETWEDSANNRVVSQVIRPTGLLDPEIEIKAMDFMVDDIMKNISLVIEKDEKMLITTLTKKSSEELTDYLVDNGIKVQYLHSEIDTLDRLDILKNLRTGKIDVIVGVNLLREGLDLPEVSRICILDSDKQGFLRSTQALIQIIGRAARNKNGKVIMYVEKIKSSKNLSRLDKGKIIKDGLVISESMKKAIDLTYYRRGIQRQYNKENNIKPKTVFSSIKDVGVKRKKKDYSLVSGKSAKKEIARLELEMDIAATNMEYEKAAELRDEILELKQGKKKREIK